jgi:hypothetical protein
VRNSRKYVARALASLAIVTPIALVTAFSGIGPVAPVDAPEKWLARRGLEDFSNTMADCPQLESISDVTVSIVAVEMAATPQIRRVGEIATTYLMASFGVDVRSVSLGVGQLNIEHVLDANPHMTPLATIRELAVPCSALRLTDEHLMQLAADLGFDLANADAATISEIAIAYRGGSSQYDLVEYDDVVLNAYDLLQ